MYFPAVPSNFGGLTNMTGNVALDILGARNSSSSSSGTNITLTDGYYIDVVQTSANVYQINFNGVLSYQGTEFSLIQNGSTLELSGVAEGLGITITQYGNDLVFSANIDFSSTGTGDAQLLSSATGSSAAFKDLTSGIPHFYIINADINGNILFSSDVICTDGRPSLMFNNIPYCDVFANTTTNSSQCNGGAQYNLYGNNTLLQQYCASGSFTLTRGVNPAQCSSGTVTLNTPNGNVELCMEGDPVYDPSDPLQWMPVPTNMSAALDQLILKVNSGGNTFINSSTVTFTITGANISANAILSLFNTNSSSGISVIGSTSGNTGFLRPLIGTGAISITTDGTFVYIDAPIPLLAYTITSTLDGTSMISSSTANSTVLKSFVDSSTVTVSGSSATNVSFNAVLALANAQPTGTSVIAGANANTGIFKTFFSNIPGFSLFDNGTGISFNSNVTCSDGRPSIMFNGTAACNWQLTFGPPVIGVSPAGSIIFTSDAGSTSWNLIGPSPFIPANSLLWPANTTLVEQALNYLGIYRAQNGVCPSGGQAMITVNGVSICANRIDSGPAVPGCKNGVYNLDSGIGTASVCQIQVLDGADITVDTLVANFSLACGGLNTVTDTLNCIWNNYIYPGLINQTSAGTIVYTPPFPVNCQSSFTISAMLTYLIVSQLPNNTFNVYVNPISGDDTCGGGTFARPYATLAYAVSKIPPAPVSRLFNIILSVNTHTVTGDLYLPPNVQFTTTGNLRFTTINVTGNIYLNSTWSLYANDVVFGGFSGITLYYNQMVIDLRTLGSYGPSSNAHVEIFNSGLFGNGIYIYGRGSVDLFHLNDIDADNDIFLNCATFHQEDAVMDNADTIITDVNCTTPVAQSFRHEYRINGYLGTSSLSISQITSGIHAEIHNNGFDDGSLILLGTIQDELVADVSGLPINLYANSFVAFEIKASAKGMAMANLSSSYWGNTFLTVDAMFLVVQSYLKMLTFSGSGQSLLDSSTVTTNTLKGLRSLSSGLTITPASGTLDFTLVPSAFITIYNTSDPRCDSAGGWTLVISGLPGNITGCYGADTDTSIYIAFNGTGISPLVANNVSMLLFKGWLMGANIVLTSGGNDNTIALAPDVSTNTVSVTNGFVAQNGSTVCYANGAGTFTNCMSAASGLGLNTVWFWPTTAGVNGQQLAMGAANQLEWITPTSTSSMYIAFNGTGISPLVAVNASFLLFKGWLAGLNIVLTSGGNDNTIATTATPTFTSMTITATSNQFTIGATNLLVLNFAALAAGYTLTIPDFGGAASLVGTLGTQTIDGLKTFSSQVAFSATSNQFLIGTTNLLTLNFAALASPYTLSVPDFGGAASLVGTLGTQTIGGLKTFSSQVAFSATSNQFLIGTTNPLTVNFAILASSYTLTIPDFGGAASLVGTLLAQTIGGVKTFSAQTVFSSTSNQVVFGTTNTVTLHSPAPAASRTYTIPDTGANSAFVMTDLAQTIGGVKTFTAKPVLSANVGAQFNNAGNTASVTVATQAGLASSITLNLPTTVGNNGDVAMADGANNINFAMPSVKTLYSSTAILTQTNPGAAVFVTFYPAGTVSLTIPANTLVAGSKIRFKIFGTFSSSAASTITFRNRLDGVTVYGTSAASTGLSSTTLPFECTGFLSIFTAGAGGTALSSGRFTTFSSTTNVISGFTGTATTAIDTTVSHTFDTQFAYSATNAANIMVILGATVQHIKPYA